MKFLAITIIAIAVSLFLSYTVFLIAYFLCDNSPVSIEQMGSLGDAVSGLLNPFLTIANIGVFIYLTVRIDQLSRQTTKTIAEKQLKFNSLYEAKGDLKDLLSKWKENLSDEDKFFDMYHRFFSIRYIFEEEVKVCKFYTPAEQTLLGLQHDFKGLSHDVWPFKADDFESKMIIFLAELEIVLRKSV